MFIRRLQPNVYDVFVGNGWFNWTRVRRINGGIEYVAGNPINPQTLNHVKARLLK